AAGEVEFADADLRECWRRGPSEFRQAGGLRQVAQLPAERPEDGERVFALVEQPVQDRQGVGGTALTDGIEDLESVRGAAAADQEVHVFGGDRLAVADERRQLRQLLVEQAQR